jgi:hypothetical protein
LITAVSHNQLTAHVRQLVYETFREFGLPSDAAPQETILVRDGLYCGRRFDAAGLHAIWFLEEGLIKVYGPEGLLKQIHRPGAMLVSGEQRVA